MNGLGKVVDYPMGVLVKYFNIFVSMYKNGIKIHSIVFLLIFSKKTCKIINKCITFAPSKDVVLQELCHTFAWQMYDRC